MLDGLSNVDLSGIAGSIYYNSGDAATAAIMSAVLSFIFVIIIITIIMSIFSPSKTKIYREKLVDLYIAGLVRQEAAKDKVNLEEEYKLFLKDKKKDRTDKKLDEVIEEEKIEEYIELKEKIKN